LNRNNKSKVNSKLAEQIEESNVSNSVIKDERFKNLFNNKDYEIDFNSEHYKNSKNANKVKKINQEIQEQQLDQEESSKETQINNGKIVNPELIKLKEQLLARKRKKIDKLYGSKEEDLETSLDQRIKKESRDPHTNVNDEFEIMDKINKLEVRKFFNI
jgi:hypothetical protein